MRRVTSRLASLAVVFAIALIGAACGAGGDDADGRTRTAFTASEVAGHFRQETGLRLRKSPGGDEALAQLGFGLDPAPALVRRYGIFSVYVVGPGNREALASLLADKATGKPLEMDGRGIRWERDSLSRTWVAHKVYGENVVLVWFSESKRPRTDERWARLDAALAHLDG